MARQTLRQTLEQAQVDRRYAEQARANAQDKLREAENKLTAEKAEHQQTRAGLAELLLAVERFTKDASDGEITPWHWGRLGAAHGKALRFGSSHAYSYSPIYETPEQVERW